MLEVTGDPTGVEPCSTVNVTAPVSTGLVELTVADSVTLCPAGENVAVAFVAAVVVLAVTGAGVQVIVTDGVAVVGEIITPVGPKLEPAPPPPPPSPYR